jgi:hypothetical protein
LDDLLQKWPLHVTDFAANGVLGGLAAKQVLSLNQEAKRLFDEAEEARRRYLGSAGSAEARALNNNQALQKFLEADELARQADSVGRRVGSKIPLVGLAITGAGIGYDISQGKPVVKATISGVAGSLVASAAGAKVGVMAAVRIGAMLGVSAGPIGVVVGAVAGLAAGVIVSAAVDVGYDYLPAGVRDGIEGGTKAIGDAVADVGKALESGVKNVWDAIF